MVRSITFLFIMIIFVFTFVTCTKDDSTFNPSSSNNPVYSICAVRKSQPDTSLSMAEMISSSEDSIEVTINDDLFFIGYVSDSNKVTDLRGTWNLGNGIVDSGFGIKVNSYASSGEYIAEFIITDELGNSDTSSVKAKITDEIPVLAILSSDTIINSGDSVCLKALYSDDGEIVDISINDSTIVFSDSILWISEFVMPGSSIVIVEIMDDDSHKVSDSLIVYVNSIPDSIKLITPVDGAVSQSVNPVFTWIGYDHDYYDTLLSYTLITIRNGTDIDTVFENVKNVTEHTLATALLKGETVIWYMIVTDIYGKTIVSDTFSFTTVNDGAVDGAVEGYVHREGLDAGLENFGITIKAYGSGSEKGSAVSDSSGYYLIDNLTGAITLVFEDYGFKAESTIISIVNGDTVSASTNTLQDTLPPIIEISFDSIVGIDDSVNLSWIVKDSFYTVDSINVNFGNGSTKMISLDTIITFNASGDYPIQFNAYDPNGNVGSQTISVHVNFPPTSISLISPSSNASVAINTSQNFMWSCNDSDNLSDIVYTLYKSASQIFHDSDIVASAINDTTYFINSVGTEQGTFYWKVIAMDGFDTLESSVDSFNVGDFSIGKLQGYAFLEGMENHSGIKLTAKRIVDSVTYEIIVNDSGYYSVDLPPESYNLYAKDTLYNVFADKAITVTVVANDTVTAGTLLLLDNYNPHINCSFPIEGDTLKSLSPREITVTGTFIDTGSQVKPDSVVILLNNDTITNATVTSSLWSFDINSIDDGLYRIFVSAKDGAGHEDTLTRIFYVNSKSISSSTSINHDTITIMSNVSNVSPILNSFYVDIDGNGSWDDSIISNDSVFSVLAAIDDYSISGVENVFVKAVDDSGMIIFDTISYTIGSDSPVANAGNDTMVHLGSPLDVKGTYTQKFGHIVLWEWQFDNGSWITCSGPDTTINLPNRYRPSYQCILRITDDKGAIDLDTMLVTVGYEWVVVGSDAISNFTSSYFSMDIDFRGDVVIAYTDTVGVNNRNVVVQKFDGTSWSQLGDIFTSNYTLENVDLTIGSGWGGGGSGMVQYATYFLGYKQGSTVRLYRSGGTSWTEDPDTNTFNGDVFFDIECSPTSTYPKVAYADGDAVSGDSLQVRKRDFNGDWILEGAHHPGRFPADIQMSRGGSAIYYREGTTHLLSRYVNSSWSTLTISGFSPDEADLVDLTIGNSTNIYLAYQDGTLSNRLSVKSFNGSSWSNVGSPGISTDAVWNFQMKKDNYYTSDVYIAYVDHSTSPSTIKVKYCNDNEWVTVGISDNLQQYSTKSPAIAIDEGKIYLSYLDINNGNRLTVVTLK